MGEHEENFDQVVSVTPLPTERLAWLVFEDGEIDGPYPAVAIATTFAVARRRSDLGDPHFDLSPVEESDVHVLMLLPNFGVDDPWYAKKYVFFSREAAAAASADRHAGAAGGGRP